MGQGLIMIGHVIVGDLNSSAVANEYVSKRKDYLNYNLSPDVIKHCIMECCIAPNAQQGTQSIIQLAGMGAMQPNVFMIKIDQDVDHLNLDNSIDREEPLWFTNLTSAIYSGLGIIMVPKDFSLLKIIPDMHSESDEESSNQNSNTKKNKYIDIWWLFDDGGLTILTGYLLTKHKKFKDYKLRIMALDEIGFEDQTDMVHLVDRMRIDAEIVHVRSGDINIDSLVTPKHTNGDVKSPSVQIVVDPATVKEHMDNSEMSKDDITATKSVTFHDNVPAQIESVDHGNDHSHDVTQTHASSNDTMMEHSMDDSATKSEGDMHSRRKRRRKVSEFAIDKK